MIVQLKYLRGNKYVHTVHIHENICTGIVHYEESGPCMGDLSDLIA